MTTTDLQSLAERVFECNLAQDYATSRKLAKDVPPGQWAEFDALVAQLAREYRDEIRMRQDAHKFLFGYPG